MAGRGPAETRSLFQKGFGLDGKLVEMTHGSAEVVRRGPGGGWRYIIDHTFGSD